VINIPYPIQPFSANGRFDRRAVAAILHITDHPETSPGTWTGDITVTGRNGSPVH
jgi:hypothetical protein